MEYLVNINFYFTPRKQKEAGKKKGKRLVVEEIESQETKPEASENIKSTNQNKSKSNRMVIEEINSSVVKSESELKTQNEKSSVKAAEQVPEEKKETEKPSKKTITSPPAVSSFVPDKELPPDSIQNKNEGNDLYRNGQYQEAQQKYTFAIHSLMTGWLFLLVKIMHITNPFMLTFYSSLYQHLSHFGQKLGNFSDTYIAS